MLILSHIRFFLFQYIDSQSKIKCSECIVHGAKCKGINPNDQYSICSRCTSLKLKRCEWLGSVWRPLTPVRQTTVVSNNQPAIPYSPHLTTVNNPKPTMAESITAVLSRPRCQKEEDIKQQYSDGSEESESESDDEESGSSSSESVVQTQMRKSSQVQRRGKDGKFRKVSTSPSTSSKSSTSADPLHVQPTTRSKRCRERRRRRMFVWFFEWL